MLRLAGCMLTALGCVGLGYWYRRQFAERLRHLKTLISILDIMMSEVRYSKASLPECCRSLSVRLEEPYREVFSRIWEETRENDGETYREIFVKNMKECMGQVPLGNEEKRLFLELAARYGFEDTRMQLSSMEQCKEQLKTLCTRLEREVNEKGKMAMSLGTLGGLLLIVILL